MAQYAVSDWHFSRLTPVEKELARDLAERNKWRQLKAMYKSKKVMPGCPVCGDLKAVRDWTKWAINQGLL